LSKEYEFKAFSDEGAILVLPEGSTQKDLRSIQKFREYATNNAFSWYCHTHRSLKEDVPNGSLLLITGRVGSMSYGAASFTEIPGKTGGSISKFSLNRTDERQRWSCSWELKKSAITHHGKVNESGVESFCVFIQAFALKLNKAAYQQSFDNGDNGGSPPTPIPKLGVPTGKSTSHSTSFDSRTRDRPSPGSSGRGGRPVRNTFGVPTGQSTSHSTFDSAMRDGPSPGSSGRGGSPVHNTPRWTRSSRYSRSRRQAANTASSITVSLSSLPEQSQVRHVST
jgi:hypothetical protein